MGGVGKSCMSRVGGGGESQAVWQNLSQKRPAKFKPVRSITFGGMTKNYPSKVLCTLLAGPLTLLCLLARYVIFPDLFLSI